MMKGVLVTELAVKDQLLKDAGYVYKPDRELYINRKARKAFSIDFLEDKSPEEIARKIHEAAPSSEWTFIFTVEPSESVKRELARLLDA
jgi:hypothetical protein